MGNAGRVLMIPKGDYNAATTYEMLDCVYYNGRSYVCKQTSTGNAPTNTTYWQPMTPDSSAEIQALTNQLNTSINDLGAKNSLPLSVAKIKALNPDVTWTDNSCVWKGITYTILTDSAGNVTGIDADGTATERGWIFLSDVDLGNVSINFGSNPTVDGYTYSIGGSGWLTNVLDVVYNYGLKKSYYLIDNGQTVSHKVAYPMRRPAGITDDTFAPYAKTNLELTEYVTPTTGTFTYAGKTFNYASYADKIVIRCDTTLPTADLPTTSWTTLASAGSVPNKLGHNAFGVLHRDDGTIIGIYVSTTGLVQAKIITAGTNASTNLQDTAILC